METSVGSTIEKIKLQEQNIEKQLKEKRERETALAALHRAIKDAVLIAEKLDQERLELIENIKKLRPLLEVEKIKHKALQNHVGTYSKMFEDLKAQSSQGITKVWNLRSSLCETVQKVSDGCDIWALLMRPVCTDSFPQPKAQASIVRKYENDEKVIKNENRLKTVLQRRKDIEAQREILRAEPENGEEFIRIKNALRYSLQKIENLQN